MLPLGEIMTFTCECTLFLNFNLVTCGKVLVAEIDGFNDIVGQSVEVTASDGVAVDDGRLTVAATHRRCIL